MGLFNPTPPNLVLPETPAVVAPLDWSFTPAERQFVIDNLTFNGLIDEPRHLSQKKNLAWLESLEVPYDPAWTPAAFERLVLQLRLVGWPRYICAHLNDKSYKTLLDPVDGVTPRTYDPRNLQTQEVVTRGQIKLAAKWSAMYGSVVGPEVLFQDLYNLVRLGS